MRGEQYVSQGKSIDGGACRVGYWWSSRGAIDDERPGCDLREASSTATPSPSPPLLPPAAGRDGSAPPAPSSSPVRFPPDLPNCGSGSAPPAKTSSPPRVSSPTAGSSKRSG